MSEASETGVAQPGARQGFQMGGAVQFGVLFLLMGPLIGTFLFVAAAGSIGAVHGSPGDIAELMTTPFLLVGLVVFGYLVGGVPALLAGLLVGAASRRMQGWALYAAALVAGFAVTALPLVVWGSGSGDPLPYGGLGAVAALVCTGVARRCGLGT
ncbi:hypothetical protein [Caulobacter sp. 17J65-9]|uniref:hypothetical protein n=1 Tax=Caulobacter sp. 17J65-9 TaxID=2709382 RepID=UPI0013CC8333|nr:hypothetical protein [Caulobacter sp. 17J65-9]NEX94015.1 hypothetical protein [Caulobacter sp. 17J65-9]